MSLDSLIDQYLDDDDENAEREILVSIIQYHETGGNINAVASNGLRLVDLAVGDALLGVIDWLVKHGVSLDTDRTWS